MLPGVSKLDLGRHLEKVKQLYRRDAVWEDFGVRLPGRLARKYPRAEREWLWYWVFPATRTHRDAESGKRRRHHLHESVVQRAFRSAVARSRHHKACDASHAASLFCDASLDVGSRHKDGSGITRPPGRADDDDLYACVEPAGAWCAEPGGRDGITRLRTRYAAWQSPAHAASCQVSR